MGNTSDEINDEIPVFTSLGMFIIDEIHFTNAPSVYDIIGGAGTFGAIGSRIFLPGPDKSRKVGWIVDIGNDFPKSVKEQIDSWKTGVVFRVDESRPTTRGWNKYVDNEERLFKYLAPKKRINAIDIVQNPPLGRSKSFHLICSPSRCEDLCDQLSKADNYNGIIIWEPVPDECKEENFEECIKVLKSGLVGIFSPNSKEAAQFFGLPEPFSKEGIENIANKFVSELKNANINAGCKLLVVRCGSLGCLIISNILIDPVYDWFPAYHNKRNNDYKVVDPTGGGNSFVGAFATGYVLSDGDIQTAAVYGNVASSLVIEQIGVPTLEIKEEGEVWNGKPVAYRIEKYLERLKVYRNK